MEDKSHEKEVSTAINHFFEKRFPLEKRSFQSKKEFLDFYVDLEAQLNDELKVLLEKIKPVPINKIKVAHNTLLENLIMSFELNSYSEDITKIIRNKYQDISEQIVKDLKNPKNLEGFVTYYIAKKLKEYIDQFRQTLVEKLKREEFPDFLVSKYIQLIKNKFLTLLSEKNIDVSYFYFSDATITFIDIYQDIFINKKLFLFNAKNKNESLFNYFILILLSNNANFKKTEMKYLDHLIQDFEYFVYIFNLNFLFEQKDFDFNYNMNKLFDKFKKEYIDISELDAEKKKNEILEKIIGANKDDMKHVLNIILSYCLILNYLVTKNKKTGDVEISISDNYTSFASMKVLLDNTLANFEMIIDVEEMKDFAQSVLIKDILASMDYTENKEYSIEKIQEILINNKRNPKLCKLSQNFLKNLQIKKYNKALEFILSINQTFKDKNVRNVNLSPLNPRVTANHCYIFISGFLSETSDHYEEWENMALNISANNTCYFYNWPGDTLSNAAGETILNLGLTVLTNLAKVKNKNKDEDCTNSNKNKNQETPFQKFDPGKSFIDSSNKAALSGKILAHILASRLFFKNHTITLVGFSLGTHVTKHCIKNMYDFHYKEHIPCNDIIKNVILIAGATSILGKEEKFKNIFSKMINGKLINCYSKEDQVLNVLYTGCMKKKPIGNSELTINGYENLKNIDFTPLKLGHTDYRAKMDLVMNKVDLYI
jgi:hypothetical protein